MQRDTRGRFLKGAGGRLPGARNRTTAAQEQLQDALPGVIESMVAAARKGDSQAGAALLRHALPRPRHAPVQGLELPALATAADAAAALAALTAATARGAIAPDAAREVSGLIARWLEAHSMASLEDRIAALETAHADPSP